jgi:epoxyqueuosine reductase
VEDIPTLGYARARALSKRALPTEYTVHSWRLTKGIDVGQLVEESGARQRRWRRRHWGAVTMFWIDQKVADTKLVELFRSRRVHALQMAWPTMPEVLARRRMRRIAPPMGARSLEIPSLPQELRGDPGIVRDRGEQARLVRSEGRLPLFLTLHHEADAFFRRHQWRIDLLMGRRLDAAFASAENAPRRKAGARIRVSDPADVTKLVRERASDLGMSAIGFARPDPLITFEGQTINAEETAVIVCILEQNWEATQSIPSMYGERSHIEASGRLRALCAELSRYVTDLGYTARIDVPRMGMNISYAVDAGLGQMGLNGQLLTPFAGSRSRINIIMTNAPVVFDEPRDFGIEAICNACRACVQNCPSGAIQTKYAMHRGVRKAKIKSERCFPIVAQVYGCGVCQKVCPVQRYGLPAVIEEYERSGSILGKGTGELEGYVWPPDGLFYGPGQRPPVSQIKKLVNPPGWVMDKDRRPSPPADPAEQG